MSAEKVNKYSVVMYSVVRMRVKQIEANSYEEAIEKAEEIDLSDLLDIRLDHPNIDRVEFDDSTVESFLVDPLDAHGEVIYEGSKWIDKSGKGIASKFFDELTASVETLSGIADQYGSLVLANLMYLQNALIANGTVDFDKDSNELLLIQRLPSAEMWLKNVRVTEQDYPTQSN